MIYKALLSLLSEVTINLAFNQPYVYHLLVMII